MIIRYKEIFVPFFVVFLAFIKRSDSVRDGIGSTGNDKSEESPTIIHFSQQSTDNNDKNHENGPIIQSDSYAKSVHQVHDFIMRRQKSQVSSSSSNDDDGNSFSLVVPSDKKEQQVLSKEFEHDKSDGALSSTSIVTRGRSSKLFKR